MIIFGGTGRNHYLCRHENKINWKQFAAFFIVIGCTYYITRNFFMTAGILMLLLLIDGLLLDYDHRRRGRKQAEEIMKGLKDEETDEEKQ